MSIQIIRNNIIRMTTDAIVDPTDEHYSGLGGADGAIHKAAGPGLRKATTALRPCPVGEARITPGYNLKAKYVIHTVGPVWQGGAHGENAQLRNCYINSLALAEEAGLNSIAFPLLASGTFGYPKAEAITTAMSAIREFLNDHEMVVYLVVFSKEALRLSEERYGEVASFIESNIEAPLLSLNRTTEQQLKPGLSRKCSGLPRESDNDKVCAPITSDSKKSRTNFLQEEDLKGFGNLTEAYNVHATLADMLNNQDKSFIEALLDKIDKRGMKDSECYKKANVDKTVFNKIKNKPGYKPQKSTIIALIFALEPTKEEFDDLIQRAGYALSNNNTFDIIIRFCLERKKFDVYYVNDMLFQFDQPLLGAR